MFAIYCVLGQVLLAASKTELCNLFNTLCTQVSARVGEQIKMIGNYKFFENLKISWRHCPVPNLPTRKEYFAQAVKNYAKTDINAYLPSYALF